TCRAALDVMPTCAITPTIRSRWYLSAPVPPSDQPWFINGVIAADSVLPATALLEALHGIERRFGRFRTAPGAARILDLDLLAHGRAVVDADRAGGLVLPHPRLHRRAFVLRPLAEVAPDWRHPRTGRSPTDLIGECDPEQVTRPLT
ncbi:MAG: 2-amino-4-hydroxy-6-hydroxymethyldihydropteridine diphosphokinase, partial [Alphaproteobacteria bacterium]|nr:2-amino-4-hydroxy-6-hydroxymethyldihydropteridine diphosphokinase [Alphaproteobacteria bacterium]